LWAAAIRVACATDTDAAAYRLGGFDLLGRQLGCDRGDLLGRDRSIQPYRYGY
jgi:hypothetical protein